MKVVFFGTPEFAVPTLQALAGEHDLSLVVTAPDRKKGRGKKLRPSPVKKAAEALNIPVFQPENVNDEASLLRLRKEGAEVFVVAAYGSILKPDLLKIPEYRCINVHGSILPKYRGAAPIERAVMEGEEYVGVSVMEMEKGLDTGPVAATEKVPVNDKTSSELRVELAELGAQALLKVLAKMEKGTVEFIPQDDEKATYAPKIDKSEGELAPEKEPVFRTLRKIQGMDTYGGAYFYLKGIRYKVFAAKKAEIDVRPGTLEIDDRKLYLGCKDGSVEITELQAPNKRRMDTGSYLLGNEIPVGIKVGDS